MFVQHMGGFESPLQSDSLARRIRTAVPVYRHYDILHTNAIGIQHFLRLSDTGEDILNAAPQYTGRCELCRCLRDRILRHI